MYVYIGYRIIDFFYNKIDKCLKEESSSEAMAKVLDCRLEASEFEI